jgi:hypothetical protein
MNMKNFLTAIAILGATMTSAYGAIIPGSTLNFSGNFQASPTTLTFQCNQPADIGCIAPPAGSGDVSVSGSTGSFAQYNSTFGFIKSINNALQPLNTAFSLPNFITFELNANETVTLTFIPLGTDTASATCAGLMHCTPQSNLLITPTNPSGLSEFNLDSAGGSTALVFAVQGVVHDNGANTAAISGTFTTQFAGLNPQQTLALLNSGATNTYSASLSVAPAVAGVPEPGSIALIGIGLAVVMMNRRRAARSRLL